MKKICLLILSLTAGLSAAFAQTTVNDASVTKVNLPAYSEFATVRMMGVFKNVGTDTLKNVKINWRLNNGPVTTFDKTDLKIVRNQSWPFTSPVDVVFNTEGTNTIRVWTSMPNGVQDENKANDTITQVIQVIRQYPEKHILIEEITGAWCGYCPRAPIIYEKVVRPAYPKTIFVAVHSGDGMSITESRDFMNTYVTGIPTGFVDRKKSQLDAAIDFSPESWTGLLDKLDNKFTPVDLKVYNYYYPETREWKIDVVADFVFDMTGNFRMNCYIMEDSLFGTGSAWDQRNFFNGGASEPYMSLQGAGDPLPGYKHNHVVRKMLGGSWGQAGIIPTTVSKGDRYVYSTTFKADTKWKMDNVHLVGIIQQWDTDKLKRPIINAVEGEVTLATGAQSTDLRPAFRVYPNPVGELAWIEMESAESRQVEIQVISASGKTEHSQKMIQQAGTMTYPLNLKNLATGVYFIRLVSPDGTSVRKLIRE